MNHSENTQPSLLGWEEKQNPQESPMPPERTVKEAVVQSESQKNLVHTLLRKERLEKARLSGQHTEEEWMNLLAEFQSKCVRCGDANRIEKDHIIPMYCENSSDGIENIQPLCKSCNTSKSGAFNWVRYRRGQCQDKTESERQLAQIQRESEQKNAPPPEWEKIAPSEAAKNLGKLGGKAGTGKTKARTREQCQKAARAMWEKRRAKQP